MSPKIPGISDVVKAVAIGMAIFAGSIVAGLVLILQFGEFGVIAFAILLAVLAGWAIHLTKGHAPLVERARDLQRVGRWNEAEVIWERLVEKPPRPGEHVVFNWLICTFHAGKLAWVGPRFCDHVPKLSELHFTEAMLLVMLAEVNLDRIENAHIVARKIAAQPRAGGDLPMVPTYAVADTVLAERDLTAVIAAFSKIRDSGHGADEDSGNIARLTDAYLDAHSAFQRGLPPLPGKLSDYRL